MNKKLYLKALRISLSALLILLLLPFPLICFSSGEEQVQTKTVYVSSDAQDDGDGSREKPFGDLYTAFCALPKGGTIVVSGDVEGYVPTAKKFITDENGDRIETEDIDTYFIPYPKHEGRIRVTSVDGGRISFTRASETFCFINYGITEFDGVGFVWEKGRPVFCTSGENAHLIIRSNCTFSGQGEPQIYGNGIVEIYTGRFSHAFLTYDPFDTLSSGKMDSALFIGGDCTVGTVWGMGLGRVSADAALVLLPGGTVGNVWGGGQAKFITGSFTFINHGGTVTGSVTARSNGGASPLYSSVLGYDKAQDFSAYDKEYETVFSEDKELIGRFKNCKEIVSVEGKGSFIHISVRSDTSLFEDGIKLWAYRYDDLTDSYMAEEVKTVCHIDMRLRSSLYDYYFFAPYGTEYYAVAEGLRSEDEDSEGTPVTADSMKGEGMILFSALLMSLTAACIRMKNKRNGDQL